GADSLFCSIRITPLIRSLYSPFFFSSTAPLRDLHSFPTRRSSDLSLCDVVPVGEFAPCRRTRHSHIPRALLSSLATPDRTGDGRDRKSTRLNSSHGSISYAVFCLKKKKAHNFLFYLKDIELCALAL